MSGLTSRARELALKRGAAAGPQRGGRGRGRLLNVLVALATLAALAGALALRPAAATARPPRPVLQVRSVSRLPADPPLPASTNLPLARPARGAGGPIRLGVAPLVHRSAKAGDAAPQVALFTAIPSSLPASGGSVRLIALVQNGASCRFLLTRPNRKLLLTHACRSGDVLVNVKLSANAGAQTRVFDFALAVDGAHGKRTTSPVAVEESGRAPATAPTITGNPGSITVATGQRASFEASASGRPTPRLQWQDAARNSTTWRNISGANAETLAFKATAGENGYRYRAVFTNSAGSATTTAAQLTIGTANVVPQITVQPTSQSVAANTSATFSADASGTPNPTVRWEVATDGANWTDIPGATSKSYIATANSGDNGDQYRALFTNDAGTATTNTVTLTEAGAPQITEQPAGQVLASPGSAPLTAAASGSPAPGVQWQVSANAGASWGNISGATNDTYLVSATESTNFLEYRAVFTNAVASATSAAAVVTVDETAAENWSGYVDTGGTFSAVNASWTVPAVNCEAAPNADSSQWIGIDGYTENSDTVEQDGTEADCSNGTPVYDAWYEMFGDQAVNDGYEVSLSPSTYPLAAGDEVSAAVSLAGSDWTLSIDDTTAGWNFRKTVATPSPAPAQSSAEWIVERPEECSNSCSLVSLADFGSVNFAGATADDNDEVGPISQFASTPIEMAMGSNDVLAAPSALDNTGELFTDNWYGAS